MNRKTIPKRELLMIWFNSVSDDIIGILEINWMKSDRQRENAFLHFRSRRMILSEGYCCNSTKWFQTKQITGLNPTYYYCGIVTI